MDRRRFLESVVLGATVTIAGAVPPAVATLLKENPVPNPAQPYEQRTR